MESLIHTIAALFRKRALPAHMRKGLRGEEAAANYLKKRGMKKLASNYTSKRGEIDLIFRDRDCMVFVEVKTRSSSSWTRPAAAVDRRKRAHICKTAMDYLRQLGQPDCNLRFDIVEVWMNDGEKVLKICHIPNAFSMSKVY
ncbi:MAG: YraN family protein [Verrucomicrobiota bacterium]|nr:YraN family protein [Verrucomicrobiota bacterium]